MGGPVEQQCDLVENTSKLAPNQTDIESNPTIIQSANNNPLFQIKKWNLIAFWKWDIHSDMCAICRANVMEACLVCQAENKSSDCVIVWGKCNHSFHNCCIVKWIQQSNRCPLCQQEWKDCRKHQLN